MTRRAGGRESPSYSLQLCLLDPPFPITLVPSAALRPRAGRAGEGGMKVPPETREEKEIPTWDVSIVSWQSLTLVGGLGFSKELLQLPA